MSINPGQLIFVVDDEILIGSTLSAILRMNGYRVESFTNLLNAFRFAMEEGPDTLISDVVMPQMTGIELAILVNAACPRCKVMLLSGHEATVDVLEQARGEGHNFQLLSKPIHPNDLLLTIRKSPSGNRSC